MPAEQNDLYDVLGVHRNASDAEIKKAYRRMAMKYHPDRSPDDAEAESKFKEAKFAYEVLADSQKRAAYDQFGHAGIDPSMRRGQAGGVDFSDIFGDVFGDIFGGGRARKASEFGEHGADLRYDLEIDLEDAVFGKATEIDIPTFVKCDTCNGSGAKAGTKPSNCDTCDGYGQVRLQQGFFSIQQTCPNCRGTGKIIDAPCVTCHGQGRKRGVRKLSVNIPPGVDNGDRIRLSGEGETGTHGGSAGDLYVQIHLKQHPIFTRDGNHLHCEVPISYSTAALGGEVSVPTLDGEERLRIQTGTQSGKVLRVRGKGVKPVRGGSAGDLLCKLTIETPLNLTEKQKEHLRTFEKSLNEDSINHHPKESSWFDSVKRFFEDMKS